MMKQLNILFLTISMLFTAHQAQAMNLDLAPKGDKVLTNNTMWTIHATCHIHASSAKKTIKIHGVKNNSQVNGKSLNAGQTTSMTVYAEKTVQVTAEPGAQVSIMNLSNEAVQAVCST
ncbi:MAG: hypothetical protein CK424_01500 [Legionella sp.]|nr:MAG: hypothetical protein CK424_01500 [Legionella sp.]